MSAIVEYNSNNKGILITRMTEAQKLAIVSPAEGLLIYQTDGAKGFYSFNGTNWVAITTPAITIDAVPTNGSANPVSSDGVFDLFQDEITNRTNADTSLVNALKDGVPTQGDSLQKLYNLVIASGTNRSATTIVARNALNVNILDKVLVDDDGDGNWALYMARTAGINATYIKISDPDLLNAVLTNSQIKTAYESNSDTNAFTNALKSKLDALPTAATLSSDLALKVDKVTGSSLLADTEISRLASMTAIFTTALKTAYDTASNWIITNGATVLAHLTRTDNPHTVTKSQVGLGSVPDTDFTSAVSLNTAKITNATHTGDVTGATALTITPNAVTNAKLAQVPSKTFKGRTTASTGDVEDLTVAQVKADLAINLVDNTSDVNKPVSTAGQAALLGKYDKIPAGTGLLKSTTGNTSLAVVGTDYLEGRLGANIASASTTTIGTEGLGETINITGSVTINSFGVSTTGTKRKLIFVSGLIVNHNVTSLICINNGNMQISSEDILEFVCINGALGHWKCVGYQSKLLPKRSAVDEFFVEPTTAMTTTVSDAGYTTERIFFAKRSILANGTVTLNSTTGIMTMQQGGQYKITVRMRLLYSTVSAYTMSLRNLTTNTVLVSQVHNYSTAQGTDGYRDVAMYFEGYLSFGDRISLEQPGGWNATSYNYIATLFSAETTAWQNNEARKTMFINFSL